MRTVRPQRSRIFFPPQARLGSAQAYAKCSRRVFLTLRPLDIVNRGKVLAYLAGVVDDDGYFKVTKEFRKPSTVHPYYRDTIGLAQLWPGDAVRLFAATFGRKVSKPLILPSRRLMVRCELYGSRAHAATRGLLPYLLLKKDQALLLLAVAILRQ